MDMNWLDDVLILLEEGNMTRAAARRNITQPAFSRRIRSFEDWLGVNVLDRGTNKINISPSLYSNETEIRALVARINDLKGKLTHYDPTSTIVSIAAQHSPIFTAFPDMSLHAKKHYPSLKFRLRAANLRDCVTMFLRGDTSMLLCYESNQVGSLPFGETIKRELWGNDYLVPVVGGKLRFSVKDNGLIPIDTPSIAYPEDSYFGQVLSANKRTFGTPNFSKSAVCETAFSNGIKEMVTKGIGVGWLPISMIHRELENGQLISLSNSYGKELLEVAIYADTKDEMSLSLLDIWGFKQRTSNKLI
jgi:DNA-binding transcriptional LysR family regulator